MPKPFVAGLYPGLAIGGGLFVSFVLWMVAASTTALIGIFVAIGFAVFAMWMGSVVAGALAGIVAAPFAKSKGEAVVAGALSGAAGAAIVVVATITGIVVAILGAPESASSGGTFNVGEAARGLVFVLPGALAGAIAAMGRAPGQALSAPSYEPAPRPEPAPDAPPTAASPPQPSYSPAVSGAAPVIVQCPRCSTRIQAPPQRPVLLVCPTCQYRAMLRS